MHFGLRLLVLVGRAEVTIYMIEHLLKEDLQAFCKFCLKKGGIGPMPTFYDGFCIVYTAKSAD